MIRIGVDFGGTKIEAAAIDAGGGFVARVRRDNPRDYQAALETVRDLVTEAERQAGVSVSHVGVGSPGSLSPTSGLMRNASSTWLNGQAFDVDLRRVLGRQVTLTNDADCFALSEALPQDADGVVFGAILGTGCGGGVVVHGRVLPGRNRMGGEWGHTPLPWATPSEYGARQCWCGRENCLETWISGTGFEADYAKATGRTLKGPAIVAEAADGDSGAQAALDRYIDRLGRALAMICNILDPDVIVLGGGMSNVEALYGPALHETVAPHAFSDVFTTPIRPPLHGDSSGVRGAAWLVPE
jgi:fructokinase